jgi:hypothetical protein
VPLSNLGQGHATSAVSDNLPPIHIQSCPADLATLQPSPSHATFDSLDYQTPLEFTDRSDNDDHGATQRAGSVDVFAETDESNVQVIEFVQYFRGSV